MGACDCECALIRRADVRLCRAADAGRVAAVAIYHFSAKVISRANGSSAVAAAAYRSASRLEDERLGRAHDFTNKTGVIHSEVMRPEGMPERWADRLTLWNEVEAGEKRKDAQLAREVEVSIPREMSREDGVALVRDFAQREFVDRGMVADVNVHWDRAEDGSPKPHAHIMLSMRRAGPDGFGPKEREWNGTELLTGWRERWGEHVNGRLAELGVEARIDHRSYRDQGVALEPQNKIGPAGARREERGEGAERAAEHRDIARRNGEAIIADPRVALDAITRGQSTFTDHDLARFVHRHSDDPEQFREVVSAVKASPELVMLGRDGRGRERFSTRDMLEVEQRLERSGGALAERQDHEVDWHERFDAEKAAKARGLVLSEEQVDALRHITGPEDLSLVMGYAGTGKSAMLGVARDAWERSGFTVRGAALSGIAAENLEAGAGIGSRTLASMEHGWGQGRDLLTSRDVLVIDEAGMIGSRQLERVLTAADKAGAKVVLVGDPEQLQAIEAGAAFRALSERHGAAEITEVRRQREEWQRLATRQLATGGTEKAVAAYEAAGMVEGHSTREEARAALVDGWAAERRASPKETHVILAHTRADVAELNQLARERMRQAGVLGAEVAVSTERGERTFAEGDRVMFLRNERGLGVKNGTLGVVVDLPAGGLQVRLDDGREVGVDLKAYGHVDHGYAATIHKAQGVTVDRAHVLATPGLDRHAAYVALSRHRDGVALHYGADDFADRQALDRTLGRERAKDTTLDYAAAFAERRDIDVPERLQRAVEPRPAPARSPNAEKSVGAGAGLVAFAEAWNGLDQAYAAGRRPTPEERQAYVSADAKLKAIDVDFARGAFSALDRTPGLAAQVGTEAGRLAIGKATVAEATYLRSPENRADRWMEDYTRVRERHAQMTGPGQAAQRQALDRDLKVMVADMKADPQMHAVLQGRRRGLEVGKAAEREIGKTLSQERERNGERER